MEKTVLVPTWRRPADLKRCLDALANQTCPPQEVIVTARADDDDTWRLLRARQSEASELRPLPVEAPGVVASLNAGLAAARGELVAITDDDAVPRSDWLERIEGHLKKDAGLGGVGGRDWIHEGERSFDGEEQVVGTVRWFGRVIGNHHLGAGAPRRVDILKGANMALRTAAVSGVRLDESLRGSGMQYHWEIQLCLAVKRAGWRLLYDPRVAVDHYPAPRFDEDQRVGRPLLAVKNAIYNETLTLARGLPWPRKATALLYGLIVGTRASPGVVTGIERALRRSRRPGAFAACTRGRLEATRDAMRVGHG